LHAPGPLKPPSVRPNGPPSTDPRRAQLHVVQGRAGGENTSARWRVAAAAALRARAVLAKPILASDVLKDEVAPLQPWAKASRWVCAAAALALLALSFGPRQASLSAAVPSAIPPVELAFAIAFAVAAILPLPYVMRALAMAALGLGLLLGGMFVSSGSLHHVFSAPLEGSGGVATRTIAATCLAATLFFRSHYRAYVGARALLALAWVLALPFLAHAFGLLQVAPQLVRLTSAFSLLAIAATLTGFMGAGTTALATTWAFLVLVALPLDLALRPLFAANQPLSTLWLIGVGVWALACGVAAFGLFQTLASLLARHARDVDVMRPLNDDTQF
jgi:hypothetical protein